MRPTASAWGFCINHIDLPPTERASDDAPLIRVLQDELRRRGAQVGAATHERLWLLARVSAAEGDAAAERARANALAASAEQTSAAAAGGAAEVQALRARVAMLEAQAAAPLPAADRDGDGAGAEDGRRRAEAEARQGLRLGERQAKLEEWEETYRPSAPLPRLLAWSRDRLAQTLLYQAPHSGHRRWPPRITVVTPVFNAVDTVRDTLESVLGQEGADVEYIVVDGGSTDGTLEVLRAYERRLALVISEPDQGLYDAVAKGFERASGEVLCYLNADDRFEAGALARVSAAFAADPGCHVIYFEDDVLVAGWKFANVAQPRVNWVKLLGGHIVSQDGVFFSRRAYNAVGGLNRDLRLAGDWDLWMRLSRRYRFRRQEGHVSTFQVRTGQLSGDMAAYEAEREAVRRSWLQIVDGFELRALRVQGWKDRVLDELDGHRRKRRGRRYYPIDFWQMPAVPGRSPEPPLTPSASPFDHAAPTALLFSKINPTLGERRVEWVYQHEDGYVAVHPPLAREHRAALRAASIGSAGPIEPLPRELGGSPFIGHALGRGPFAAFLKTPPPRWLRRFARFEDPDPLARKHAAALLGRAEPGGRVLDVGCEDGAFLDQLREQGWATFGCEPSAAAAEQARARGHAIWIEEPEQLSAVTAHRFEAIVVGELLTHFDDPLAGLIRLSTLLMPGGRLVVSGPNLDSGQRDLFGPTWWGWHASYRRHFFSAQVLGRLSALAELRMEALRTFTTVGDVWRSRQFHRLGVGVVAPLGRRPPEPDPHAEALAGLSRLIHDPFGRGERLVAVLRKRLLA